MKRRYTRSIKRQRDLIWITTIIQASLLETTGTDIGQIVLPSDWSVNQGFDRATLRSVRGWISFSQVTAGTATDVPMAIAALAVRSIDSPAGAFNPYDASEYTTYDVLYTWLQGGEASTRAQPAVPVNIKAMRKLSSSQQLLLTANVATDTASPRFNISGILRALVQLDPPS